MIKMPESSAGPTSFPVSAGAALPQPERLSNRLRIGGIWQ